MGFIKLKLDDDIMDVECTTKNRYNWLDISKGFGIIFVVIGHVLMPTVNMLTIFIYSFHIPLFFIVAGYTYNGEKYRNNLHLYIHKRGRQLLIPYITLYGLILLIWIIFAPYFSDTVPFNVMAMSLIYGNGPSLNHPHVWFLSALFFAFVIFVGFEKILWNRKWAVGVLIILFSTLGIYVNQLFAPNLVPWHLDAVLFCSTFIFIGNLLRDVKISDYLAKKKISISLIFILFPALVIISQYNGWVDIAQGFYGNNAYILLLTGTIGTILLFAISSLIESTSHNIVQFTKFLGQKSQVIYEVHPLFIYAFMPISLLFAINSIFYVIVSSLVLIVLSMLLSSIIAKRIEHSKIMKLVLLGKK